MMGRRPAPCPLPPAYDPLPNAQREKTRPDWIIRKDFNGKADFMESLLSRHKDVYEITKEDQLGQRSEDLMLSALWQFMPLSCGFSPSVKLGRALITSWWWHEHELIEGVAVEVWMFLQLKKIKMKWCLVINGVFPPKINSLKNFAGFENDLFDIGIQSTIDNNWYF